MKEMNDLAEENELNQCQNDTCSKVNSFFTNLTKGIKKHNEYEIK